MTTRRKLLLWLELLLLALAVGAVNLVFPRSPGFSDSPVNPYLLLCLLVAAYYGRYPGFLFFLYVVLIVLLPLPYAIASLHPESGGANAIQEHVVRSSLVPFVTAVIGVYLFGLIRDSGRARWERTRERLRRTIREKVRIGHRTKALERVNRELEERVYRQNDSLTALYSQVQNLRSYDLAKALDTLLDIIERFSQATSTSIWEYHPDEKELRLVANRGGSGVGRTQTVLPVGGSIEGWVVRNDMIYSVRMLKSYVNLQELDDGRIIMTLPIKAGSRIWGVLDIEAMPFERYNRYTERLLQVIMALVSPALEPAVENETTLVEAEAHRQTGLPTYPQFHAILEKELYRAQLQQGSLSVVILEIANAADLRADFGDEKYYILLNRVIGALRDLTESKAQLFHYQQESQLALLYRNLDLDGASLSCLEILSMITSTGWTVNEQQVSLDAMVGYASLGEKKRSADELLDDAEHLLEMQKV